MLLFLMWLDRHFQSIWASLQYLCDILKKVWNEIRNLTSLAGLNPTLTVCYSFHIVLLPSQYGIWLLCLCNLTLPVPFAHVLNEWSLIEMTICAILILRYCSIYVSTENVRKCLVSDLSKGYRNGILIQKLFSHIISRERSVSKCFTFIF